MSPDGRLGSVRLEDLERTGELLRAFLAETGARCALLINREGQLLSAVGDRAGMDETTFASLAAADFAASDQIAMLLGEKEFASLYHQGEPESMYLAATGPRAILAILFGGDTTLGLVRVHARTLVPQLARLLEEMAARTSARPVGAELGAGWVEEAEDEIDRLFGGGG